MPPVLNAHSGTCPFCSSDVPESASVCTACGSKKGLRAESLGGGSAIMRAAIWCNTLGLIIFAAGLVAWNQLHDERLLQGTEQVCFADVMWTRPAPIPQLAPNRITKTFRLAPQACEDTPDLEPRKTALLRGAQKPENGGAGARVEVTNLRTAQVLKNGGTTFAGWALAISRALGAIGIGGVLFWVARKLWVRVLGRLSDPMWIRSR